MEDNASSALESMVTAANEHANLATLKKVYSFHYQTFAIRSARHHASYQAMVKHHAFNRTILACSRTLEHGAGQWKSHQLPLLGDERRPPISGDAHIFVSEHGRDVCSQAFPYAFQESYQRTTPREVCPRFKLVVYVLEIGLLHHRVSM